MTDDFHFKWYEFIDSYCEAIPLPKVIFYNKKSKPSFKKISFRKKYFEYDKLEEVFLDENLFPFKHCNIKNNYIELKRKITMSDFFTSRFHDMKKVTLYIYKN